MLVGLYRTGPSEGQKIFVGHEILYEGLNIEHLPTWNYCGLVMFKMARNDLGVVLKNMLWGH